MSYQDRLERIRSIIAEYNSHAPNAGAQKIDANSVMEKMVALGAVNEESAAQLTWEDLQSCGLPKIMAKQAAAVLRTPESPELEMFRKKLKLRQVDRMTYAELFQHYNPREDDLVTRKLADISKGKPCVVFTDEKALTVDVATSVKLLEELRRGLPPMTMVPQGGSVARVFMIGEIPDDELDQNPLYPSRALRLDETCDQTVRSWKGVPLAVRQILFLAITKTGEAKVNSLSDANDLLDRALAAGEEVEKFGNRYPKATLMLMELNRTGQAPRLKLKPSATKSNSPFASASA